jgi:peroxiredoxin
MNLLKDQIEAKTRVPLLIAEMDRLADMDRQPKEICTLYKRWCEIIKKRVDAIDASVARKKAIELAQRVIEEYPKLEAVAYKLDGDSRVFLVRAVPSGKTRTYAQIAEKLLFELKNLSLGQPAPDFEGPDAESKKHKLSDLRGKVVVLMFSANWCLACKQAYPALQELQKTHIGRPLEIVTIMADDKVGTVKQALDKKEITWRALWDGPSGPIATRWNVQAYPTIYVLDSAGVIRARDISAVNLADLVEKLLAESAK